MSLHFFALPSPDVQEKQDELGALGGTHSVVQIDRSFAADVVVWADAQRTFSGPPSDVVDTR